MATQCKLGRIELFFDRLANIVIAVLLGGMALLFLYLVCRFSYIKPYSRILVFILPFAFGGLLSLFKSPTWKVPFALCAVSIILPLYSFEIMQWPWAISVVRSDGRQATAADDLRSDMDVLRDLRQSGKQAMLFVPLNTLISSNKFSGVFPIPINGNDVIPLGGPSDITTVLCKEGKSWSIYESDEHGFNNPKGLYQPGSVDIAFLGDSFIHGYCVPPQGNVAAHVRKIHPKTINLGVGGAGTLTRLAIFREYVEVLKPKIVLWTYTENTLRRVEHESILKSYLDPSYRQHLYDMQPRLDAGYETIGRITENVRRGDQLADRKWIKLLLLKQTQEKIGFFLSELKMAKERKKVIAEDMVVFQTALSQAKKSTESWGGQLVFVYLPIAADPRFSDHEKILSEVRYLDIPVIDLLHAFDDIKDPLQIYPRKGGHPNEYGYALIAAKLSAALKDLQGFNRI